jgi:hypothetical protein
MGMTESAGQNLLALADEIRDMGWRVINNGPEPFYASEKLGRAAEQAVSALALPGWRGDQIARLVDRAIEHGRWLAGLEATR